MDQKAKNRTALFSRKEHSMDQYQSRLKLSENFERHWSIQISGEIHMDQSLVYTFSWGNSYGFNDPWMALPSSHTIVTSTLLLCVRNFFPTKARDVTQNCTCTTHN